MASFIIKGGTFAMPVRMNNIGYHGADRREKILAYRTLPSLKEYVLVATDKRQIEIYRRDEYDE